MPIMNRLMTKSMAMISTEETTTACVVERPTPCVPPRRIHAVIAADGCDDEAEEQRFNQALQYIGILQ